uniref:Uncharacterized protein n=1 Tax=Cacopsylla melanoneura TaxID=428564 RepID=A0A8D8Y7F5_9HEMI
MFNLLFAKTPCAFSFLYSILCLLCKFCYMSCFLGTYLLFQTGAFCQESKPVSLFSPSQFDIHLLLNLLSKRAKQVLHSAGCFDHYSYLFCFFKVGNGFLFSLNMAASE